MVDSAKKYSMIDIDYKDKIIRDLREELKKGKEERKADRQRLMHLMMGFVQNNGQTQE